MRIPDEAEVTRILAIEEPVLRNLCITQCYSELAAAYATRVSAAANWCAFATWASRQAGHTIRGQDFADLADRIFARSPDISRAARTVAAAAQALGAQRDLHELDRTVRRLLRVDTALQRSAQAVALGNAKVFAEIGREFARFVGSCFTDEKKDDARATAFSQSLRAGDPPEGQQLLRNAFARYYQALFEANAKRQAELMLFANLEVGLHEQNRLQPEIQAALDAAVPDADTLVTELLREVFRFNGWAQRIRRLAKRLFGGPTPLDHAATLLVDAVRREVRRAMTEHLMTLALPRGQVLGLGKDLSVSFPTSLQQLDDAELRAFVSRVDPTPDSALKSSATDWADLAERMHFIADLFRCYQESSELLDAPFTAEQCAELRAGRIPAGAL